MYKILPGGGGSIASLRPINCVVAGVVSYFCYFCLFYGFLLSDHLMHMMRCLPDFG